MLERTAALREALSPAAEALLEEMGGAEDPRARAAARHPGAADAAITAAWPACWGKQLELSAGVVRRWAGRAGRWEWRAAPDLGRMDMAPPLLRQQGRGRGSHSHAGGVGGHERVQGDKAARLPGAPALALRLLAQMVDLWRQDPGFRERLLARVEAAGTTARRDAGVSPESPPGCGRERLLARRHRSWGRLRERLWGWRGGGRRGASSKRGHRCSCREGYIAEL